MHVCACVPDTLYTLGYNIAQIPNLFSLVFWGSEAENLYFPYAFGPQRKGLQEDFAQLGALEAPRSLRGAVRTIRDRPRTLFLVGLGKASAVVEGAWAVAVLEGSWASLEGSGCVFWAPLLIRSGKLKKRI